MAERKKKELEYYHVIGVMEDAMNGRSQILGIATYAEIAQQEIVNNKKMFLQMFIMKS